MLPRRYRMRRREMRQDALGRCFGRKVGAQSFSRRKQLGSCDRHVPDFFHKKKTKMPSVVVISSSVRNTLVGFAKSAVAEKEEERCVDVVAPEVTGLSDTW